MGSTDVSSGAVSLSPCLDLKGFSKQETARNLPLPENMFHMGSFSSAGQGQFFFLTSVTFLKISHFL